MSTFTHIKGLILNTVGLTFVFLFICYAALLNLVHDKTAQDPELKLGKRTMQVFTLQKMNQNLLKQVRDLKAAKVNLETELDSVKAELASERKPREDLNAHFPYICDAIRISQEKIENQQQVMKRQEKEISEQDSQISNQRSEIHSLTLAIHELRHQLHIETMKKMEAMSMHTKCHMEFRQIYEQQSQSIKELIEEKNKLHYDRQMLKLHNHKAVEEMATFIDLLKEECTSAAVAKVEMEEEISGLQKQVAGLQQELEKRKAEECEYSEDEEDEKAEEDEEEAESDSDSVAGFEDDFDWVNVDNEGEISDLDLNASAPDAVEQDEAVVVAAEANDEYDELYE